MALQPTDQPTNSTTEYLKKLKLLLNKSQSQLQALAQTHRAKVQAAAAAAAAQPKAEAPSSAGKEKEKEGELAKYYVDVDPEEAAPSYGQKGDAAMQMMIQRPPIAPGE